MIRGSAFTSVNIVFAFRSDYSGLADSLNMKTRPMLALRRTFLIALTAVLALPLVSAKKAQTALEWKTGFLWESPDACIDTWSLYRETFLIVGEDTLYHVSHRPPIVHKPNVTERSSVQYALADGDFYLQDEEGRVFKLAIVKQEMDSQAQERIKSGKLPCQP